MSLLFDSLSLPETLSSPISVPFASLHCTESSSENRPREYLVSLRCGGELTDNSAEPGWIPPLLQRGGDAPEAPIVVEDDDEDEKKPRRVIFAAGTKIHIDSLKGADVVAASSRVALESDRRDREAQKRNIQFSRIKGGAVQVRQRAENSRVDGSSYTFCVPPQTSSEEPAWLSCGLRSEAACT